MLFLLGQMDVKYLIIMTVFVYNTVLCTMSTSYILVKVNIL